MGTSDLELAHIFREFGEAYRQRFGPPRPFHERVIRAITQCRTAELGGHLLVCDQCGVRSERFKSCCNRHCPKCQGLNRYKWLEKRQQELLPVEYFHLVFTVPQTLNPLFLRAPKAMYNILLRAAADTLLQIAADPKHLGAKVGCLAMLHTWGQQLQCHPHIHMIVPGGGLSDDGEEWVDARPSFFLSVKVLGKVFRGKFLEAIELASQRGDRIFPDDLDPVDSPNCYQAWLTNLRSKSWVVYSKPPFGGSAKGLEYLARYTHQVAISDYRLLRIEEDRVYFQWKDYRDEGKTKEMSLEGPEFIRRFLVHILPRGFQRVRYYGLFANRNRARNLEQCRLLLGVAEQSEGTTEEEKGEAETWEERVLRMTGVDPTLCTVCGEGRVRPLQRVSRPASACGRRPRAPP